VAPPVSDSRLPRRSPGPSVVPEVSLGADPVFSGERFLLPIGGVAQGLSQRSSRFFFHPQDIYRLSPVHGNFPPGRPQIRPQILWITDRPALLLERRDSRRGRHGPRTALGHRSLELASICRMSWAAWRPRGLKHGGINRTKLVLGGTRRDISRPRCAQNGINRPPKCTSDGKCRRCRFARPGPRDIWGLCPRHRGGRCTPSRRAPSRCTPGGTFLAHHRAAAARSAFLAEYRARVPGSATRAAHMRGERRCWSGA
jgi:hypothetical protein